MSGKNQLTTSISSTPSRHLTINFQLHAFVECGIESVTIIISVSRVTCRIHLLGLAYCSLLAEMLPVSKRKGRPRPASSTSY